MASELKPCPFCRATAKLNKYYGGTAFTVVCDNLHRINTFETEAEAVATWNTRPAPAATDTGLETVEDAELLKDANSWYSENQKSEQSYKETELKTVRHEVFFEGSWRNDSPELKEIREQERSFEHPVRELCDRSQAEELLAGRDTVIEMQADSIDKLERKVQHWQDKHATLEADNAALAARIKDLGDYAREATKAITGLTGGGSENFGKEIGDVFTADLPYCVERIRERYVSKVELKRLEAKLTAAEKALEARDALINNLVKHVDALPDDAEFYGLAAMWASRLALMLGEARAALGGKSS